MKVEGHPNLDKRGGTVVNTDTNEFIQFLEKRRLAEQKEKHVQSLEERIAYLENIISQLLEGK